MINGLEAGTCEERCKELIHLSRLDAEALGYYSGDLCFQQDWNKGFGAAFTGKEVRGL